MAKFPLASPRSERLSSSPRNALKTEGETGILTGEQDDTDLAVPWHVVIYNDPVNLMPYVTMVIQRIFGYPEAKARMMMLDVHYKGQCIAWTGAKEQAELYVHQLQSYQLLSALRKATE